MTNRDDWVDLGMRILDDGRVPAEIGAKRAGQEIGVGKGSFIHHFGDVGGWYRLIIDRWKQEDENARAEQAIDVVRDPLDRLRQLRRAAERHDVRRTSMRRWARSVEDDKPRSCAADAEKALRESDEAIFGHVTAALSDLGLAEEETAALALVLAPEVGCGHARIAPGGSGEFEALLAVVARAAGTGQPVGTETVEIPGGDGQMLLCIVATRPGASIDRDQIRAGAMRLAEQIRPSGGHTPGTGAAAIGGQASRP